MSDTQVEEIKSRVDLAELIGEYVKLQRAGTSMKGLCPFHNEKTPSFNVSPERQIWHCFGCGEGGDAFTFLMRMEGLEFPDALRQLAERTGVKLRREDPKVSSERTKILDAIERAAAVFHTILLEHEKAEPIRAYLRRRGIDETMWQQFRLGYAPDRRDFLATALAKYGIDQQTLFDAGLLIREERGTGMYDRFRGRLLFPIANVHGATIGFGGRALQEGDRIAKYINTPQTLVYNKSEVLYGIHLARQSMRRERQTIVVEGYTDCITAHQAGVTNTVAASGTAFTEQQIQLIKRYAPTLLVAFDADLAGEAATKRGIVHAIDAGLNVKVVRLPEGKDPADLITQDAEAWRHAVTHAAPFMDYFIAQVGNAVDLGTAEGKKHMAAELLPVLARIPDRIEQTHYLQQLSGILHVDERILREAITRAAAPVVHPRGLSTAPRPSAVRVDREERLLQRILALILAFPDNLPEVRSHLADTDIPDGLHRSLYSLLGNYYNQHHAITADGFRTYVEQADQRPELLGLLTVVEMLHDDLTTDTDRDYLRRELHLSVTTLRRDLIQRQLRQLHARMQELESQGPAGAEEREALTTTFSELTRTLASLETDHTT